MSSKRYETIKSRMSEARLDPYERHSGGAPTDALALYEWNMSVSGALFEDLGVFEILLRNTTDLRLRRRYQQVSGSPPWYQQVSLQESAKVKLAAAIDRLAKTGNHTDQNKVVAELNFGFWRYLLSSYYASTLWPVIQFAFVDGNRDRVRREVMDALVGRLYDLRNRIAHHEPIFAADLGASHADILRGIGWMCPDTRDWVVDRSRVPAILAARPGPLG